MTEFGASPDQARFHLLIERDIGSAKPVNRLLRISDHKQLSRSRARIPPVGDGRIIRAEQQQDLDLQRVGILELVNEKMRVAPLQLVPDRGVIADEIASLDQKIEEIEPPDPGLEALNIRQWAP
jgi:hypothetical protein